jgi:hypothetical protein
LREQQEFLASNKKPSVTVIRKNAATQDAKESQETGTKPLSRFAQMRQKSREQAEQDETEHDSEGQNNAQKFRDPMSVVKMPVIERDPSLVPVVAPSIRTTPFPQAKPRHLAQAKAQPPIQTQFSGAKGHEQQGDTARTVIGMPSRKEIHEENLARLGAMSAEERRAMQASLSV